MSRKGIVLLLVLLALLAASSPRRILCINFDRMESCSGSDTWPSLATYAVANHILKINLDPKLQKPCFP